MAWGKVKDEDFVGREAHLRQRDEDPAAILCTLTVDDHTSQSGVKRYMLGREPILGRDGSRLVDRKGRGAYVTSAGRGAVDRQAHPDGLPAAGAGGGAASGSWSSTWASATLSRSPWPTRRPSSTPRTPGSAARLHACR